jgi:hypothetical protein
MKAQPKTSAPDRLTGDEKRELLGWVQSQARPVRGGSDPFFLKLAKNKKLIRHHVDRCLVHFQGTGIKRPGWMATVKKWLLTEAISEEEKRTQQGEKPKMTQKRGRDFTPLSDLLAEVETKEMFEGE